MRPVKYSFLLTALAFASLTFSSHVFAGTAGVDYPDRDKEIEKMMQERRNANYKARIKAAANRMGLNIHDYRFVQSPEGEIYIYSNQQACVLIKGYVQDQKGMPKEVPANDTLYCR